MRLDELFSPIVESYSGLDEYEQYMPVITNYFEKKRFLYRGMEPTSDIILGNSKGMNRISSGGIQYVNLLVDYIMPEWSKFPKRFESFICSTNPLYADKFGIMYYVIPLEKPTLAIASTDDFWGSFSKYQDLAVVLQALYNLIIIIAPLNTAKKNPSIEEFKEYIRIIDEAKDVKFEDGGSRAETIFRDIKKHPSCMDFFRSVLDPSLFKLSKDIPTTDHNEVWFSGKCLFIQHMFAQEKGWI